MGSSGGGSGNPNSFTNQAPRNLSPAGRYQPNWVSFLPSGGASATGLTPAMEAGIAGASAPAAGPPAAANSNSIDAFAQQLLDWQNQYKQQTMRASYNPMKQNQAHITAMRSMPTGEGPAAQLMRQQLAQQMNASQNTRYGNQIARRNAASAAHR